MRIRIYNARILTMVKGEEIFLGEIQVENGKIIYVGNQIDQKEKWDREIDAKKNLILPGFKNAHTHSAMTFLRSYADDVPLQEWLYNKVFPMEEKLTSEDAYWCTVLANMEYLTSGITANFDMYLKNQPKASVDTGFRTVLCGYMNDFVGSVSQMEEDYLKYQNYHELISYQLGFHAEYTTKKQLLEKIAMLSQKYKTPVYTHNSETKKEVKECIERYGLTPTSLFDELGMCEYGGGGFHCIYMSERDLEICQKKKLWVVTNPSSNLKLASGIAPLQKMKEYKIGMAIGTDGAASNNCLDMFREMFLTTALQKAETEDASAMDAMDVLEMATVGGAKAMGLENCDTLEEGKCADLIMLDLNQPNMQPLNHIAKNIVYSGSKQNVKMTMINGKILYEDNKFYIGLDPEEVYQKANEAIERMKQ